MTRFTSILYLFFIHLSLDISLAVKTQDLEGFLHPSNFRIENRGLLVRQKRAGTPTNYEVDIEISYPDVGMEKGITDFLRANISTLNLGNTTKLSSLDIAPGCNLSGSLATCRCSMGYDCIGTLGACTDTECICVTTLPLQKYCIQRPNNTVSPDTPFIGDTATITCSFIDASTVSWFHNSVNISNNPRYSTNFTKQGLVTLCELKIKNLQDSDKGTYTCSSTVNGTTQNTDTVLSISNVNINTSSDFDTFCDNSNWTIYCCCDNFTLFNVTWQIDGATVTGTNNSTCIIYTVTADSAKCPSAKKYTCTFIKNEGATYSKTININYIGKANINFPDVPTSSAYGSLTITCKTDIAVKRIELIKENKVLNDSDTTSVLYTIGQTTTMWSGDFMCKVYQSSLTTSKNITVKVVALPRPEAIQVSPPQSYVKCENLATLTCCVVNENYKVYFNNGSKTLGTKTSPLGNMDCFNYAQSVDCHADSTSVYCTVTNELSNSVNSINSMTISQIRSITCPSNVTLKLPETPVGFNYSVPCQNIDSSKLGNITYSCKNDRTWDNEINECYSAKIFTQLLTVKDVIESPNVQGNLPVILESITNVAIDEKGNISNSAKNIDLMVEIISTVTSKNITVSTPMMTNLIQTVDIVVDNVNTWKNSSSKSSTVLESVESFAKNLQFNDTFTINNPNITNVQLFGKVVNKDSGYNGSFLLANLSSSVTIENVPSVGNSTTVVSIAYSTMKKLLPQNQTSKVNTLVMSTVISNLSSSSIDKNHFNITMIFRKDNTSLKTVDCVWLDSQSWNNTGCSALKSNDTNVVKCTCNHLTSFSALMGDEPYEPLALITYIGVGISIASLVITLIIEAVVWRSVIKNKTSYMRHICLVNIAMTLLIADIWFLIGAGLEKYPKSDACKATAFFSFYFYLSLFFWMLVLGLILFYRLIYLLHDMSRRIMVIIAFTLGYGCPLLISVITVATTAPSDRFTNDKFCWLSRTSGAFLAFVVPALSIVFINFIILIVVIVKLLRPTIGERPGQEERQNFVIIAKSIAVLTPLLGTTWALGVAFAYNDPNAKYQNQVLSGIFSALNSFQGLFILISTVFLDRNVRKAVRSSISTSYWSTLRTKVQTSSSNSTAFSKPNKKNIFVKKGGYDLYSAHSSSNDASTNSYSVLS
ncbi:adhesion G protein-coupled receptor F5-like [Phyllobates terribilis]|uniref:adhesion G protein-coupled receptor F5-like n=1 Tax=Phyllobates terribilis TaxID=111132 RepID=UPI003CCB6B1F